MALIAVHAVIDIIWIALVARIRLGLAMTICALKDGVVVRIRVARGANPGGVTMIYVPPRVVKSRAGPCRRVVASSASGRKDGRRRFMDGIGGAVVVHGVAAVTIGWQRRVVVVHMAAGTGHLDVETSKRINRIVVVKRRVGPESGVMAELTCGGKAYLYVVDRRSRVVVIL